MLTAHAFRTSAAGVSMFQVRRFRFTALVAGFGLLAATAVLFSATPDDANRQKTIAGVRIKLQLANGQLAEADDAVTKARHTLADADTAVGEAADRLAAIAKRLEDAQPSDSRFARARSAHRAAAAQFEQFKTRPAASSKSDPQADAAYKDLRRRKTELDSAEVEILSASLLWKQAAEELRQAQSQRAAADAALQSALGKRAALQAILADAINELATPAPTPSSRESAAR
jgi:chromosome segregation ATPase